MGPPETLILFGYTVSGGAWLCQHRRAGYKVGFATTWATSSAMSARHPLAQEGGAKLALQEGRDVEVSIELGPMKAKPGGRHLYVGKGF